MRQNAQGLGETHCNQATGCVIATVASAINNSSIALNGNANSMYNQLTKGTNPNYKSTDLAGAMANARNGGLSIVSYFNSKGNGHIATFSVGDNISKGAVANIGPSQYTGFISLNGAIAKDKPKSYFILTPAK